MRNYLNKFGRKNKIVNKISNDIASDKTKDTTNNITNVEIINNIEPKKKGISLIALVVVIIIMLILTASVIITTLSSTSVDDANEAVIRTNIQAMKDRYEIVYKDALFQNLGDESKLKDSDFEGVVPDNYKEDFQAGKDGLEYIGDDEQIKEIADEMGLGKEEKDILEYITAVAKQTSVDIEAVLIEGKVADEYIYYIREKGEEEWDEFSSTESKITIVNLKEETTYEVKVIVKQGEKEYESEIREVVTKDVKIGNLIMKLNDVNGEEYKEDTWTNENVYIEVEGINTSYSVSGANEVSDTSASTVLTNEGISTVTVKTTSGENVLTKEYIVKIDRSSAEITEFVASTEEPTNKDIIITGKAVDSQSGITAYQFSKEPDLTEESNGWNVVDNITTEITRTYTVSENGTYYFYIKDEMGNVIKKEITIDNIDKVGPTLESISVVSPESGTYSAGEIITIVATYSENIAGTVPVLKIKFGEGEEKTITEGIVENNTIKYTYTLAVEDKGVMSVTEYAGTITDLAGNSLTVSNTALSGSAITALTQSIIQSWTGNATTDFHAEEYRTKITKAKFTDSINVPEGATSWDVSDADNGSVMAYVEDDGNSGYILTIAGNGEVVANSNSNNLFMNFTALTEIENMELFDTGKATTMANMFQGCTSLTSLDVGDFETVNVTNMEYMFNGCGRVTSLDVSKFNTVNVTNMRYMFNGCGSLTSLDVNGFDTSQVKNMSGMFFGCSSLTSLDVSRFNTSKVIDMGHMFRECNKLTSLDVSGFDTSQVKGMSQMFRRCYALTNLDLSNFNTSNVTSMSYMFNECKKFTSLDVSSFDTSNVTSMEEMFCNCKGLITLNLSNFDTSSVINMKFMFNECSKLESLDISNFNTSQVTSMYWMFRNCNRLTNLDVSSFDTSNVKSMEGMFVNCANLVSVDVSNFNTSSVTNMGSMFNGCSNLKTLDLSNFNTSNTTNMTNMFYGCSKLQEVSLGEKFSFLGNGTITTTNQYLPAQSSTNIEGADGKWYNIAGIGFAPNEIPNNVADTYTAISPPSIIQSWVENATTDFHNSEYKSKITKAKFESSINVPEGATSWDVSDAGNGSVMAYVEDDGNEGYILIIAGNGGVIANSNSNNLFMNFTALTEIENMNLFDTGKATTIANMFQGCTSLTTLDVGSFETGNVTNMWGMFYKCNSLTNLDVSSFDTSNVTSMGSMFRDCSSLTSLDVSNWNVGNVTSMGYMFYNCGALTSIDVSSFDTSNVTNMEYMFDGCSGLTSLWVNNFNTSKVANMNSMFGGCSSLTSLDLSNWNTSSLIGMFSTFAGCEKLTSINLSNFETTNVKSMKGLFRGDTSLLSLDLSSFDTSNVEDMYGMFYDCSSLTELDLNHFNTGKVKEMGHMFFRCSKLESISLSNFDTSSVTNMEEMFHGCSKLTSLDVGNFNMTNVKSIKRTFSGCSSLTSLNVSKWDVSNITNMYYAFLGCSSLTSIDVSNWNTSSVKNFGGIFQNCAQITALNTSNWDTSNATDMGGMFWKCNSLTSIDVSKWDTSNVTNMSYMFAECSKLDNLDVSNWDVSNVIGMGALFDGCSSLTILDLSKWNTSKVTTMAYAFRTCQNLTATISMYSNSLTNYTHVFVNAATVSPAEITVNYTTDTSDLVDSMIATKSDTSNVVKGSEVTAPIEENITITTTVNKDESGTVTGVYLVTEAQNAISNITVLNSNGDVVKEITLDSQTTYSEILDITDAGTYEVIVKNIYNQKERVTFEI